MFSNKYTSTGVSASLYYIAKVKKFKNATYFGVTMNYCPVLMKLL